MKKRTIPITRPTLAPFEAYAPALRKILKSGVLTNGENVANLEKKVAAYLGVKHAIAVSSCTSGLMLVLKGLGVKGEVIMPSFTFSASGHAILWNDLKPVFADIDPYTYEINPRSVEERITKRTSAILPTQIFGHVCDSKPLERLARKYKLKLIFDAAHAFGSIRGHRKAGVFGDAEVFSCSPTKLMTTAEGGIIATNNDTLATFCRIGRTYGDDGSYNTTFNGLSARMSELHAVIGLRSFSALEKNIRARNKLVAYYKKNLLMIDRNLQFQKIPRDVRSTYKDFSIFIDPEQCGYTRDELYDFLATRGVMTRKYFYPPLHMQQSYATHYKAAHTLPVTERIASNVLSAPLYSHMTWQEIDYVLATIKAFYVHKKLL